MSPNPQETANLTTFTEEILNGKLHFLCSETNVHLKTILRKNIFKHPGHFIIYLRISRTKQEKKTFCKLTLGAADT